MRDLHKPTTHAHLIDHLSEIQLGCYYYCKQAKTHSEGLSDYATTISVVLRSLEQALQHHH